MSINCILVTRMYGLMHVKALILYDNNFEIKSKYYNFSSLILQLTQILSFKMSLFVGIYFDVYFLKLSPSYG